MPAQPERTSDDVDPTGIRELLASLPDPGPMPEDLVRRIEARLAVEQAHRAASGGRDGVIDLAAERSRRRPARAFTILGAAAAGLVVTTVAITQLTGSTSGGSADTAASYPSLQRETAEGAGSESAADAGGAGADEVADAAGDGSDSADDDAAGGAAPDLTAGDAATGDAATGADAEADADEATEESAFAEAQDGLDLLSRPAASLLVLPALGPVDESGFVARMLELYDAEPQDRVVGVGDLTLDQAASCWAAVDDRSYDHHLAAMADLAADGATTGGRDEVVTLLGLDDDGTGQGWVLPVTCATDPSVAPVSGPHSLPTS